MANYVVPGAYPGGSGGSGGGIDSVSGGNGITITGTESDPIVNVSLVGDGITVTNEVGSTTLEANVKSVTGVGDIITTTTNGAVSISLAPSIDGGYTLSLMCAVTGTVPLFADGGGGVTRIQLAVDFGTFNNYRLRRPYVVCTPNLNWYSDSGVSVGSNTFYYGLVFGQPGSISNPASFINQNTFMGVQSPYGTIATITQPAIALETPSPPWQTLYLYMRNNNAANLNFYQVPDYFMVYFTN
jgi:hypothetical protein